MNATLHASLDPAAFRHSDRRVKHLAPLPTHCTSPAAKEAATLWEEVEHRRADINAVLAKRRKLAEAFQEADAAYRAEVDRCAAAGEVSAKAPKLRQAAEVAHATLESPVHAEELAEAEREAGRAEGGLRNHLTNHARELYEEAIAPAVKLADDIRQVREELNERIREEATKLSATRECVRVLFAEAAGPNRLDELLPTSSEVAPELPDWFLAKHTPTPDEKAAQEAEEARRAEEAAMKAAMVVGGSEAVGGPAVTVD